MQFTVAWSIVIMSEFCFQHFSVPGNLVLTSNMSRSMAAFFWGFIFFFHFKKNSLKSKEKERKKGQRSVQFLLFWGVPCTNFWIFKRDLTGIRVPDTSLRFVETGWCLRVEERNEERERNNCLTPMQMRSERSLRRNDIIGITGQEDVALGTDPLPDGPYEASPDWQLDQNSASKAVYSQLWPNGTFPSPSPSPSLSPSSPPPHNTGHCPLQHACGF